MANYPYTGSTVVGSNGKNVTSVGLSTHILIKATSTPGSQITVGAVQSLRVGQSGSIKMIQEVGTDGNIDSCRSSAVKISGSCTRIRFDKMRMFEAFGKGVLNLKSLAYPVDIWIYDRQASNNNDWIVDILKNVWFNSLNITYSTGDYVLSEEAGFDAEDISSILVGTQGPAATGGRRGSSILYDTGLSDGTTGAYTVERATDAGVSNRRGALDISGLIDLGYR